MTAETTAPGNTMPRPEYPRPQLVRKEWLNLNGHWEFEIDHGDSGLERGLVERELTDRILVPFAPESEASGIAHTDFMAAVWYRRTVDVPAAWAGQRVLLHFGAVDHDTTVWVNGCEVGRHRGGFTSFTLDITDALANGGSTATIVVRARDEKAGPQARGKQSTKYANHTCHYTRTTGIWQTVWLEPVPAAVHLRRLRITPQLASQSFEVSAVLTANRAGDVLRVRVSDADGEVAHAEVATHLDLSPAVTLTLPSERVRPWSPEDPHLYGLQVELVDTSGAVVDAVDSYAGLRSISIQGRRFLLNGKPVFQRLVLDQGYWPDTIMTAPSDDALVRDIELSMAAGFNGARLHQKVFEERFLHHADRLGYLVWGEFADWGARQPGPYDDHQQPTTSFVTQWLEALERDVNHPAIIGWCPLNETWQWNSDRITQLDDVTRALFLATKLVDPTRPALDASGYSHRIAEVDIYDSHSYEQDPEKFATQQAGLAEGAPYVNVVEGREISTPYGGQPYFVSEYGGIWWNAELAAKAAGDDRAESWGYGQRVGDLEEFHTRFAGLTAVLRDDPQMFGYCYTQLTDTFQEQNGIFDFERNPKFDLARLREVQQQVAAYEAE